ncbi:hypothetical protein Q3G72_008230 [Acer saccharum]|nr:hypothetical protein Q3G72_008230 [Acer saccharum]
MVMLHSLFLMTIAMNHRDTAALAAHLGGSSGGCVILFSLGPPMYIENCDHIKEMAAPGRSETVDDDHPMEEEKHGLNLYETFYTLSVLKSQSPCWVAGYSSMKVSKSMEDGETYFNRFLSEERSKVGDLVETDLVNQSSSKKWSKVRREALVNSLDGRKSRKRVYVHRDTHTVVTVLVAATKIENFYVPKTIDYKNQLYDFLTELQSISKTADILALEVICNPPNEKDVKSVEELQKEYPQLFTISD